VKIDTELNDDEKDLLLLMLGAATVCLRLSMSYNMDAMLSIVNKLMKDNPSFTQYVLSTEKTVQ
jgi:hypothetical protein